MRNVTRFGGRVPCCLVAAVLLCASGAHADIASPGPDNAALLYYQAFLLRPDFDDDTWLHVDRVLRGGEPDDVVRAYLDMAPTREALRIAVDATEILDCSWGITRRGAPYSSLDYVRSQVYQLLHVIELDALTLAFDGDYSVALERCLSMRTLAQHIADEGILGYLSSMSFHSRAMGCIRDVLGSLPPDADALTWLQAQLSTVQGAPPSPGRVLEINLNDKLELLGTDHEAMAEWRGSVLEQLEDEGTRQEFLNLTDEEFLERARGLGNRFLAAVNRIIGGDVPYRQKSLDLQGLKEEWPDRPGTDPDDILSSSVRHGVDRIAEWYEIYVGGLATFNVTRAAVEIYRVKAETGQLPDIPPPHLPKDPFTGQDLEYEVTGQGFILRFPEKEIGEGKSREYEFVVVQ